MKKGVYVETTIISYLTADRSRDLIRAARQELTREWWEERRHEFDLFISQIVFNEISAGDKEAAKLRLELAEGLPFLAVTGEAVVLAEALVTDGPMPRKAGDDAFHLALAAVHGIDFLLTWNCRHLANARLQPAIEAFIMQRGYEPPVVCTPDSLMEIADDV